MNCSIVLLWLTHLILHGHVGLEALKLFRFAPNVATLGDVPIECIEKWRLHAEQVSQRFMDMSP
jgi:hypothetical protein